MTTLAGTAALSGAAEGERLSARAETRASGREARERKTGSALALESVSLSFGGVAALKDVDVAFGNDAITAVIGPNGAGKTSLVNVITGVYTPDSGRVVIRGRAYRRSPTTRLASLGIARTFQNLGLFKGLSTYDNVATGLS